ncbi:MAG TPA: DNA primase [Acidimicrobiales bacterium]|nr:DNA primase [Acidimicrobiales bacterium]
MGIVEEDIARVRAATDLVAVASEHMSLRRVGTRWTGLCPFHTEKSPSFSINAELGVYYCFGCQASGDAITFVRELDQLDFKEAVERLAGRAGISLRYDDEAVGRSQQRRAAIHDTLEAAISWYQARLNGPDAGAARHYLRAERGYDADVVGTYRIGWAPDGWDGLIKGLGRPVADLLDAGLATRTERGSVVDFFRGRIIFPIFDAGGRPIGAGGRMLPGGRQPKYKNTSGTAVYDKSQVLYGLNWAKREVVTSGRIVICEGYTDVIGLQRAGIGEAVATCGTALADGHVKLLTRFARRVVLAYDADGAGQHAAEHFYEWERRHELDIRVAALPAGADPADLARSDPGALRAAIDGAQPYLGFRLARLWAAADLATPEGRARAAAAAVELVDAHPNPLVRDQYLMQVADRCRIDPERLRSLATGEQGKVAVRPAPAARRPAGGDDDLPAPTVTGVEREALRLAVHRPEEVAARLHRALFASPLAVAVLDALMAADDLHEAIDEADPAAAALLRQLAVEDPEPDADDIVVRLVERAGQRCLAEVAAEMRGADDQAAYAGAVAWLKLAIEALRPPEAGDPAARVEAEEALVGWLIARAEPAVGAA